MGEYEDQGCISCFMRFGVPKGFTARRRDDRKSFYCPGCGTSMAYNGEKEADRLRRELDRAKQNEAYLNDRIRAAREDADRADRRRAAACGQVTKLRKRAQAGTCSCCNRTFKQLAAHMADKHPRFSAEPVESDEKVVPLIARA